MSIQPIYRDLWPELTKAACAMVHAHMNNETMVPALDDVAEQFPNLTRDQLACLWMGVNAKDREGLIGGSYRHQRRPQAQGRAGGVAMV